MSSAIARRRPPAVRSLISRARTRRRIVLVAAVVVVAGAAAGAWLLTRPAGPAGATTRIVPVTRTTLSQTLSASGTIEPKKSATLSFSAPGQVIAVEAQAGDRAVKGEPLASMDSPTLRAQAAQAEASLAGAQSQLSQDQSSSASAAQLNADQASVDAAQSQVNSANAALSGATLTAPFSGIVTGTGGLTIGQQLSGGSGGSGDAGSGSGSSGSGSSGSGGSGSGSGSGGSAGSTGEITLVSVNDIVNANVDASVVGRIKAGDKVEITTGGTAEPVSGTVHSIGLVADTSSGVATFPVVVNVSGTPSGLYAGASATISIIYRQIRHALVVPAAAIQLSGPHTVVYVMSDGHKVARDVTTGLTSGGLTQITHGLAAGERVVVTFRRAVTVNPGTGNTIIGPGGRVFHVNGGPGSFVPAGG